ncbi:PAS domain-containing serine/threonine-protein kinase [Papilio xuthus]|uniref:PAS domain-containing serine/threonine-protein kinase n=1 Tax=Papilio xuthus TaxID=66420 RepID=A0A194PGH0_PAPXU|nr:PAS domain-containing serine/threonine-protein kinase [Papilio xuthus]
MEDSGVFNLNRNSETDTPIVTPVKPRLGKFFDVYSPEHLNLSPKITKGFHFNGVSNEIEKFVTPEKASKYDNIWRKVNTQRKFHDVWNNSFEGNQSFPRIRRKIRPIRMDSETPTKLKQATDLVRVDGPNGLRFNSSLAVGDVPGSSAQSQTERLQQAINTSKAVFTIEPSTFKILIVNNKACSLLGYSSGELCGLRFSDLIHNRSSKTFSLNEQEEGDTSEDGTVVLLSGKVVELLTKDGTSVQVSLWIRQLDNDGPCLVIAEPVSCKNVVLTVDAETGIIVSCDGGDAALLFQADSADKLVGLPVASLIPSIHLPSYDTPISKNISKQKATGRTLDGGSFPLCLWISKTTSLECSPWTGIKTNRERPVYIVNVRVTFNVSGLLVVDEAGIITACNQHFAMLTFGKSQSEVIGHHITDVIPNFCREADMLKGGDRNRNMTLSPVNNGDDASASDTDDDSCGAFNGSQKSACMSLNVHQSIQSISTTREKSSSALCLDKSSSMITHTPTPTQDMVSSISTTEQRNDTSALPDVTSAMSGISIDDENYCHSSISKSRSENILRSEQSSTQSKQAPSKPSEKSESIYYTSQHSQEVTPTGNTPRLRLNDPSLRLSFDSSKCKSVKVNQGKEDKSSISLDFCDSNETSADFLTPINEMPPPGCEIEDLPKHNGNDSVDSLSNDIDLETQTESAPRKRFEDETPETPCVAKRLLRSQVTTSTPQQTRAPAPTDCGDGAYRGLVLHKDGTELHVVYTVSTMQLCGGSRVRCVWLGVRREDARHATLASSLASTADNSLVMGNKSVSSRPQSMSLMSQCGEEQLAGEYSKHYVTLKQIGKGAYGCVKMAYRRSDRLLTVAKFILKEKVGAHFWVDGPDGRKVPLELSLLTTLKHPNIVSVLDVFENDKYFQMVMEKHGAGMDLFEFIERRPRLDEPLISYIFRQIGQAVEYLHSLNILHRDIKDENVIIDNKFHVKLIDFGSATFMSPDTLFSTFYGTTEYCSPEVLTGNNSRLRKVYASFLSDLRILLLYPHLTSVVDYGLITLKLGYAGPELEMWSMGITLYVLTFFVNPFSDIEDTVHGALAFPQMVSEDMEHLLRWMLCKEPAHRCSVPQLMSHPWIKQPVNISNYIFHEVIDCDRHEANPEMYFSGSLGSPKSSSPVSLADPQIKERSNPSEMAIRSDVRNVSLEERKRGSLALHALSAADRDAHSDNYSLRSSADVSLTPGASTVGQPSDVRNVSREERKRGSLALHALSAADRDAHSDNYSLRSSADVSLTPGASTILDISSKPVSDAALTDISSDATGHAACDIDCDCDHYDCDSWDECEQDSFS